VKASADGAYEYFKGRLPGGANIAVLGRSLGGGVTGYLAKNNTPHGIIMQSTFANIKDAATVGFPITGWVIKLVYDIDFDTEANLKEYNYCYYQSHSKGMRLGKYAILLCWMMMCAAWCR
jgi:esterase/lipase